MKLKKAIIIAAFVLLCTVSVRLSSSYFAGGMSTQTAHVLTSLRALHDWGFFTLRGVSVLIPHARELEGLDFGTFTMDFDEAIYLSYPSGWLDVPYAAFVVTHALVPSIRIGPSFLFIFNIIVDRLLTAVLLLFFFPAFLAILMQKRLLPIQCALSGLFGCALWLLSPAVLYWTQNAYGMDEGVIPFIVALLLFITRKRCRISECGAGERTLLFVLIFFCCFIDWYGWVAAGIAMAASSTYECFVIRVSWRRLIAGYVIPLCAVASVGVIFLYQLWSFPDGFHQLIYKYGVRSAHSVETAGMAAKMWRLWHDYLPFGHAMLFLLISCFAYVLLLRKSGEKALSITLAVALFLPPFLWTILLPEHSAVHEFSLLKFAVPTATLLVVTVAWFCASLRTFVRISDHVTEGLMLLALAAGGWGMVAYHDYVPIVYQDDEWAASIVTLMHASVGPDDVPLSDDGNLVGSRPPHKLWYADRWIYPPGILRERVRDGLASADALKTMHPVYLRSANFAVSPDVERICGTIWTDTHVHMRGSEMLTCRTDALRALYDVP